jgi:hypothetical protein
VIMKRKGAGGREQGAGGRGQGLDISGKECRDASNSAFLQGFWMTYI